MVYVPLSHANSLKQKLFQAGAGNIGNYSECCWQVTGVGQFLPNDSAQPHLGQANALQQVEEARIEMVLKAEYLEAVIMALHKHHPYEQPAYHYVVVNK